MNLLADFKSLLAKGNAISVGVGVAIGLAVFGLAVAINMCVFFPILDMLTGGGSGIAKLDFRYFKLGTLIACVIGFAVTVATIYAVFVILLPMLFGRTPDDSKDSAPLPPPPAPPV